ncbi:hypothetical protein AC579_7875 [Pseudocercospora musae]|uniref:Homeobox domain-containing protein n=1 Tax=Pseudocercospora musae TaxID=113226 RepID=A0A139I749_9PEZI|nr:hypothetical protein AC579_7875 [Pseudocercospora musae]
MDMDSLITSPNIHSSTDTCHALEAPASEVVGTTLQQSFDNRSFCRQKRRRTSPQDQVILEAAYKNDPKPDKAARLELVKHISLGEKEVQIWFQNRRQSSRRKSRPLLPPEIAQYQLSRGVAIASTQGIQAGIAFTQRSEVNHGVDGTSPASGASDGPGTDELSPVAGSQQEHLEGATVADREAAPANLESTARLERQLSIGLSSSSSASADETSSTIGYLANRRSELSLQRSFSVNCMPPPVPVVRRELRKSSSLIRLSMDSEGKAMVTTKDASSPSPPRPQQHRLRDDTSASEDLSSLPSTIGLKRSFSGRSRDSRSWEFWCDKESRNQLETAAVRDARGSATGAIGLLRNASGRSVLGTLSSKQNQIRPDPNKRQKHELKRSTFQRSSTASARLQNSYRVRDAHAPSASLKRSESDKENWAPQNNLFETRSSDPERSSTKRLGSSTHFDEDRTDPEADPELAAFMDSGKNVAKASRDDDLDCVHGLLSLSQGNWR